MIPEVITSHKDLFFCIFFLTDRCGPWPGASVGWSVILYTKKVVCSIPSPGTYLGCGFDPQSGCVQGATDRCFSLTLMFLSLKSINISFGKDWKERLMQDILGAKMQEGREGRSPVGGPDGQRQGC